MRKAQLSFVFKGPGDKASDTPVFYFSSFFLSLVFKSPGDTASDNIPVLFMCLVVVVVVVVVCVGK